MAMNLNNHCNVSGGAISTRHDIDTSENLKIINCRFIGNYGHWNDFDENFVVFFVA
mgnify:CR=1 FL=1